MLFRSSKLVGGILVITASVAAAQSRPSPRVMRGINEAVGAYQVAIACGRHTIKVNDVAVLTPYKRDMYAPEGEFVVVWVGDVGCSGGSGSVTAYLAIVTVGAADKFVVDPLRSEPVVTAEFPAMGYERIVSNTNDTIVLDAAEYGPDDANCCPSMRHRFNLKRDKHGNWKLAAKNALPTTKR